MLNFSFFLLLTIYLSTVHGAQQCENGWMAYRDELCIKLFSNLETYENASAFCLSQGDEISQGSLVMIKDGNLQDFLTKVTNTNSTLDSIWLGSKYDNQLSSFRWEDGEHLMFTNWLDEYSLNFTGSDACMEMLSPESHRSIDDTGKWTHATCRKRNLVMCQKRVSLARPCSMAEIIHLRQQLEQTKAETISLRQHLSACQERVSSLLKDTKEEIKRLGQKLQKEHERLNGVQSQVKKEQKRLDVVQTQVKNEKMRLDGVQAELGKDRKQIQVVKGQLKQTSSSVVPVGSIYIEYYNQTSPTRLWPNFTWENITNTYAGLFFRALGGGSESWGKKQDACAPRVTQTESDREKINFSKSGWTERSLMDEHGQPTRDKNYESVRFESAVCEVRPKNQAIRIWKRKA